MELTISFGEAAACVNQSWPRKSLIGLFSDESECGHSVPGNLLTNPLVEPKYCHDRPASLSRLFAKIGSK